ncbi:MAG TPA: hypothetical protein VGO24_10540 [Solirubrobacterales bacterium]|nr:hypothetical protein [Solirubrobacterales bacterium]
MPSNAASLLADWGHHEFDRTAQPEIREDTNEFIGDIEHHRLPDGLLPQLIAEIHELGLREGGWTVCGAWDVLIAFMDPVPEEVLDELSEARVRFLLDLNRPDIGMYLNSFDLITLRRIDPNAHARLSPG